MLQRSVITELFQYALELPAAAPQLIIRVIRNTIQHKLSSVQYKNGNMQFNYSYKCSSYWSLYRLASTFGSAALLNALQSQVGAGSSGSAPGA